MNIGEAANPPCAVLPNPAVLIRDRLARREGSVVGWSGAHNTRVCSCARVTCTLCGSTEICDTYRGQVKIRYQVGDPAIEPPADDVATFGLDILMREAGKRASFNPFLQGYEAT
jgi:hypothetical protein